MVLAGQYLERSVVVDGLDALYHRGTRDPACVIASPHPAMGGSMTSPVIAELAWALTRGGHPTLRFDYRGVASSRGVSRQKPGRIEDVSDEVDDLYKVADQLIATTHEPAICAVGYSFGALVALRAASDPRISQLVLVAPPNLLADFSALASFAKPLFILCAQHDAYCDRAALPGAPEVIAHSDHFFHRGLTEMGKAVAEFLRAGRPPLVAQPDEPSAEEHRELELPEGEEDLELDLDRK
ncbi:MAG TPA: alpha/beta fold hydrolase [Myxococcales bacterium]|nr:alpha/beta fold hydrolase [Myxococcales bacterium]